ncbi:MAG TPA: carbonic anhydrase [Polyangiaceae bacterium]|nr:carbonic anhydrase [Polyangiaceae bacterium]
MENFRRIIDNNRRWAQDLTAHDPDYFEKRAARQEPTFLYVGCSDSRVPANVVTGTEPGELFVHRNIANLILPSDLNAMSVLQYAVEVLDVKHVIVTGHYGCGGVKAAMGDVQYGLVDHWLGHIRNVVRWNKRELDAIPDDQLRFDRVVELNVLEQIYHLSETPIIQAAWAKGRRPLLHGLVYDIHNGLLKELVVGVDSNERAEELARLRRSGVPAGPPPVYVESGGPDGLADAIAERVLQRLAAQQGQNGARR